jgi:hypothetical protein
MHHFGYRKLAPRSFERRRVYGLLFLAAAKYGGMPK